MPDFGRIEEARGLINLARGGVDWAGIDARILIPNIVERLRKRDDEIERLRAALFKIKVITGDPIEGFESTVDACGNLARAALSDCEADDE